MLPAVRCAGCTQTHFTFSRLVSDIGQWQGNSSPDLLRSWREGGALRALIMIDINAERNLHNDPKAPIEWPLNEGRRFGQHVDISHGLCQTYMLREPAKHRHSSVASCTEHYALNKSLQQPQILPHSHRGSFAACHQSKKSTPGHCLSVSRKVVTRRLQEVCLAEIVKM